MIFFFIAPYRELFLFLVSVSLSVYASVSVSLCVCVCVCLSLSQRKMYSMQLTACVCLLEQMYNNRERLGLGDPHHDIFRLGWPSGRRGGYSLQLGRQLRGFCEYVSEINN